MLSFGAFMIFLLSVTGGIFFTVLYTILLASQFFQFKLATQVVDSLGHGFLIQGIVMLLLDSANFS